MGRDDGEEITIGDGSRIKLGLVIGGIAFLITMGATGAGVIWWASALSAEVKTAVTTLKSLESLAATANAATLRLDSDMKVAAERQNGRFESMDARIRLLEARVIQGGAVKP